MHKKDPLFALIKSLKKTEKTYFKKFTQLHSSGKKNNYVELFDVINEMEEYDEKFIFEYFKDQNLTKQLHVIKNYLYKQILKSLRIYYSSWNIDTTLREQIDYITILHQKGFPNEAAKYLLKAKKLAAEYERHEYLLILLRWELRISSSDIYKGGHLKSSDEMIEEIASILSQLHNINDFFSLTGNIYEVRRKQGHVRDYDELQKLNDLLDHPLLQNSDMATGFRSKLYYYYILSVIYTELNNEELAVKNAIKLKEVFDVYTNHLEDEPSNYATVLNHLIETLIYFNRYDETILYLRQMNKVHVKSVYTEMMLFYRTYMLQLDVYLKTGQFEEGKQIAEKLIDGIDQYEGKINDAMKAKLYFQLAHLYFGANDYKTSLKWINKLLMEKGVREDILNLAMIFSLIIHFELENYDILDYQVKSTVRKLQNRNTLFEVEKLFIKLIKKIPKFLNQSRLALHFATVQDELEEVLNKETNTIERNTLDYFNFHAWILSKIHNKSYSEEIKNLSMKVN